MKYFEEREFECNCPNHCKGNMSHELMVMLDTARELADVPFIINSAYRCDHHNWKVGGVDFSAHTKGMAVDIRANTSQVRSKILKALIRGGFKRIGIYKTFIHVDVDNAKPQDVIWVG